MPREAVLISVSLWYVQTGSCIISAKLWSDSFAGQLVMQKWILTIQEDLTNSGTFQQKLHLGMLWSLPGESFTINRCIKLSSKQRCRNTWGAEAGLRFSVMSFFWIRLNWKKGVRNSWCIQMFFLADPWKTVLRIWKSWQRKQAGFSALWLLWFSCCTLGTKEGLQSAQFACYLSQNFKPHLMPFLGHT